MSFEPSFKRMGVYRVEFSNKDTDAVHATLFVANSSRQIEEALKYYVGIKDLKISSCGMASVLEEE